MTECADHSGAICLSVILSAPEIHTVKDALALSAVTPPAGSIYRRLGSSPASPFWTNSN